MTGDSAARARELARAAVTAGDDACLSLELARDALQVDAAQACSEWVALARAGVRMAAQALDADPGQALQALLLARSGGGLVAIYGKA